MKRLWGLPALLLGTCCAVYSQSSGCTNWFQVGDVTCSVGSCEGSVTTQVPGGPGDQSYSCTTVQCCGAGNYPFCYYDFSSCYWTKLDDPAVRRGLLDLAQTQDVLVVSCNGNYRPLMAVLGEERMPFRPNRRLSGLLR
jgi:hypothetical protein